MNHRSARAWVGATLTAVLLASACNSQAPTDAPGASATTAPAPAARAEGGTLRFGTEQPITGFNINTSRQYSPGLRNVVENLFFYASKGGDDFRITFPGLEKAPTVVSQSPHVVEWTIKREAVWSDGTQVTSEDLRYFREQVLLSGNDIRSTAGYSQIKSFEVVSDKTIRATFDPPYADYEGLWNDVPQAAFMKAQPGGWNTGLSEQPGPSAGPYVFRSWTKNESLALDRNPAWWGSVKPTLDTIVFRFLPDSGALLRAIANREVDLIYPTSPQLDQVNEVRRLEGVKSHTSVGTTWENLTFNLTNPILADVRVRQAIAKAIDRNAVVDALMKPIHTAAKRLDNYVFMTNQPEFESHGTPYQGRDERGAAALLDEAGWRATGSGPREKDGAKLTLRISAATPNAVREQQEALVARQLADVGIDIQIDNCPTACFRERLGAGNFDIINLGWRGDLFPISIVRNVYGTGQGSNLGKFSNARFDELTAAALAAPTRAEQVKLGNEADRLLWDFLPSLPLYQLPTLVAFHDTVVGITDNASGNGIFWNSYAWGLKPGAR